MLEVRLGSIFDQKADLIVVPCNSEGGVTRWTLDELRDKGLKSPSRRIPYGKVEIAPTNLSFENAEYVAYAASVDYVSTRSDIGTIESIIEEVKAFAIREGLEILNLPLLGTGAGLLAPLEVFHVYERIFLAEDAKRLRTTLFTPYRDVHKNLLASRHTTNLPQPLQLRRPRVFISYASDDRQNAEWVKRLATKLRESGVNARFDRFHLKPGVDLPQWMTNELVMADKVLLICDNNYMIKADIRRGGVGWETMVIQGDMLSQGEVKTKYIALLREESVDKGLPIYMKSKLALQWKKQDVIDEEEFRQLMITLFDFDLEPELGELPDYIVKMALNKGVQRTR